VPQKIRVALPSAAFGLVASLPAQAAETAFNSANTAWVLSASALVLLMTLPGLAMFYGGLVRSKNVLSVLMHCVAIACLSSVLWLACAYSFAFAEGSPFLGGFSKLFLLSMTRDSLVGTLPESVFFLFQMTFAIITPALIVGAFPERIKFAPVLVFSGLWLLLVYAPVTHWVWGGGWLMDRNIMDFAGGLVVHATAGSSALVIAAMLGPRDGFPKELRPPHNPGLTIIGAGLLWVGWYGFNGGSALTADSAAGMAIVATHMSASVAGLVWMALEWARFGRPSVVGTVTGVVAGLATVTPASGFVGPLGGCLLGLSGSLVCFFAVEAVKHRLRIDDTLDVFAVHGLGGILGTILVAFLAHPSLQGAGYADGGTAMTQLATQLIGVGVVVAWSVIMTALIVVGIRASIGLRASPDEIEEGLDLTSHGERSYTL
jgi:Amt family ammonium transporter